MFGLGRIADENFNSFQKRPKRPQQFAASFQNLRTEPSLGCLFLSAEARCAPGNLPLDSRERRLSCGRHRRRRARVELSIHGDESEQPSVSVHQRPDMRRAKVRDERDEVAACGGSFASCATINDR